MVTGEKKNITPRDYWSQLKDPIDIGQNMNMITMEMKFIIKIPMEIGQKKNMIPMEMKFIMKIPIEKFLKLDPNDQQNSHTISMIKMRTRFQPELNTYIVTTTKDLLDDYVGKGGNDFPDDILKSIQEKMKKL